ncbi:MAG: ArnT family glycosyltransferase [Candidatus Dormibacteria bacterium]
MSAAMAVTSKELRVSTSLRRARVRRWPVESTCVFLITFVIYMALADYIVIHLHYTNADAYTRVADATYVLYSRDPHLGAIGFIWPPLPAFLDIPILLLQHWFPFLITRAFAGCVEAGLFGAGTVVLINTGLRWAGVIMPVRYLVILAWVTNPMTALYSAQGMSEAPFEFFVIASFLCFLRWADRRKPGELAALGTLVGLGTLVRIEMIPVAMVVGAGVFFCSLGRKVGWRQLESTMLLFGLPLLAVFSLWIGSTWVIEHDPLYEFHSSYSQQAAVTGGFGATGLADFSNWRTVITYVGIQNLRLMPGVLVVAGAAALRILVGRDRRPGIVLLLLGVPVPLVDIYLLHVGNLAPILRYQIFVLPYMMVVGIYVLKDLRKHSPRVVSAAAVVLAFVIGVSNISSFDLMSDPTHAPEESVAVQAAARNVSAGTINDQFDPFDAATAISAAVDKADVDRGLIAMDTFRGSAVFMTAPDRSIYVVTSDEDFEAVVNQPQVYHVEYFLVPQPVGESLLDHINQLYPTLWNNGDNFATEVADLGGANHWRLYRITGVTGRGS